MEESVDLRSAVLETCSRAQVAARTLAQLTRAEKDEALVALADALRARSAEVVAANETDLRNGADSGLSQSLLDRLRLDGPRVGQVADALAELVALPDPVGEVVRGSTLPNGLEVRQVRVPMGVVAMVYEARPNVTVDAAGLALKSGNAVVLRGGSAAAETNRTLVGVLRDALAERGLPADAVCLLDEGGRDAVKHLMTARGYVDVLIPRGGAELIRTVVDGSTVPVIETGIGNCHVYVDASADLDKALAIAVNSKVHRVSVCNAAETLLVHTAVADRFLPAVLASLRDAGVTAHVATDVTPYAESAGIAHQPATDDDWAREYLSLDLAVKVVGSIDEAIDHVRRWGSGHTEAIVTESQSSARRWVAEVDAAAVMVNASTRFTDGGEFGFGAEIGISTQKLHARGPMALPELTTTKWVVTGDGQVRA
ncbi:MAG: glutamate-5-semialdehyde dehydrogenase [Actinomycetales bacterium]